MMPSSDPDRIDQALRHLGSVQPPAGFESRVVQRLDSAKPRPHPIHQLWLTAACAVAAGIAAGVLINLPGQRATPSPMPNSPASAISDAALPASLLTPHRRVNHIARTHPIPNIRRQTTISFPAPPAPLTDQEKLLILIVAGGHPEPRELLDPVLSASTQAAGDAEFERIFPSRQPNFTPNRSNP